jgi:hypothetical protein
MARKIESSDDCHVGAMYDVRNGKGSVILRVFGIYAGGVFYR